MPEGEGWEGGHWDRSRGVGISGPPASVPASLPSHWVWRKGSLWLGHWLQHPRGTLPAPPHTPSLSGAQPESLPSTWGKHQPALARRQGPTISIMRTPRSSPVGSGLCDRPGGFREREGVSGGKRWAAAGRRERARGLRGERRRQASAAAGAEQNRGGRGKYVWAFLSFPGARPALAQTVNESKPGRALPVSGPRWPGSPGPALWPPQASWRPPSPPEDGPLKKHVSPAPARRRGQNSRHFSLGLPVPRRPRLK